MKRFNTAMVVLIACILLGAGQSMSQSGGSVPANGPSVNTLYAPTTDLTHFFAGSVLGDYVASGVGMRNLGYGTINLSIPAGGTIVKAYLFWAIIWDGTPPPTTGTLNSTPITGILEGTSGSPCWGGTGINFYSADVTGIAVDGLNSLTDFPSGLAQNEVPQGNAVFPLLEGATLVLVFRHPMWDHNTVAIYTGANTFSGQSVSYDVGSYTGWTAGNPGDQVAQHTYIMADGQALFPGGGTAFNGNPTSGPGTGIKATDAFDGADGIIPVFALDGLWDTHTLDVSAYFLNGVSTTAIPEASAQNDCLTWGVHVISVKTALHSFVDIKPGSCPNSFNVNNKGNLPVAILGSPGFDVSNVNPATVELNGVPATGGVSMSDVSTPFSGFKNSCMDCNTIGPDGLMDRVFHFNSQDVAATLGTVSTNDCVHMILSGEFMDGTPFTGRDIVRIIGNISPKDAPSSVTAYELRLEQNSPNPMLDATTFSYTLPVEGSMQLAVYNMLGQRVSTVVRGSQSAGSYSVNWNGISDGGMRLTPGVYMYRLELGTQTLTRKLIISN
jgi:hypothetical protein